MPGRHVSRDLVKFLLVAAMAVCLLSLIGMPFTVGLWGKLYIIQRAMATGHLALAVITVINAAIAAAYYLKIIAAMYLREPLYPFAVRKAAPIRVAALACTLAVVAFFIVPRALFEQLAENGRLVVLQQGGRAAAAHLYVRSGGDVAGRPEFNTSMPPLFTSKAPPVFVF